MSTLPVGGFHRLQEAARDAAAAAVGVKLAEAASPAEVAYNLSGRLHYSATGYLLLSVPNSLVHGAFEAMAEPGIELPPGPGGRLNAHITVMHPDEVAAVGGPEVLTERGKSYGYSLGRLYTAQPEGWADVSRVWFIKVHSPELQALRRSYGLSSLPLGGRGDFHISVAVRKKGVTGRNDRSKAAQLFSAG